MKILICILILLVPSAIYGQDSADSFGLHFKATSVDDVISKLGKPKDDKDDRLPNEIRFTGPEKLEDRLRVLFYEPFSEWKKAHFWFLDSKLMALEIWPQSKAMLASTLSEKFKADFLFVENFSKGTDLPSFEGQKETTVPKVYPARYYMLAVKKDQFIISLINNNSFKAFLKQSTRLPTTKMFPGYIENVVIFGRKEKGS